MKTIHLPAAAGTKEPSRILIELEIFSSQEPATESDQLRELLKALKEGLSPSSLNELARLISVIHPA